MKTTELKKYIENGALDTRLRALYGEAAADAQGRCTPCFGTVTQ